MELIINDGMPYLKVPQLTKEEMELPVSRFHARGGRDSHRTLAGSFKGNGISGGMLRLYNDAGRLRILY